MINAMNWTSISSYQSSFIILTLPLTKPVKADKIQSMFEGLIENQGSQNMRGQYLGKKEAFVELSTKFSVTFSLETFTNSWVA